MDGLIVIGATPVLLYLEAAVAFLVLRRHAERVERSAASLPDRLHRLQRATVAAALAVGVVGIVLITVPSALVGHRPHRSHHWDDTQIVAIVVFIVVVSAVWLSAVLAPLVAIRLAVRPSYARMRDVPRRAENGRRSLVLSLLVLVVLIGAMTALDRATSAHGGGHLVAIIGGYVVLILATQTILPPLLVKVGRCQPPAPDVEARMVALADRMGVRVRAFAMAPGRSQRRANAVQIGIIPQLRYVVISDYLLENLTPDEADAVIAHELGHVRGRHLLLKLGAIFALWVVFQGGLVSIIAVGHVRHATAAVLLLPVLLAFPAAMFVIHGLLGVRLEERADDAAAEAVGAEAIVSALDKLAELNDSKRDTGRGWALLTAHPGFDQRLARLRARMSMSSP